MALNARIALDKMRISTALLIVFGLLFANKTYADTCFKPSGSDLELTRGCTSGEATMFSNSDEFTITIDAGRGGVNSQGTLKIGGCSMKLELLGSNTGNVLKVNEKSIDLPTTATIKQGSVSFSRKNDSPYDVSCSPTFKQVDGGNTIGVEYSMSPPVSDLSMLFKGVSIYSKHETGAGLKIEIILAILGIVLLLSGSVGVGFVLFRRWKSKKQGKRVKEEDEARLSKEESEMRKAEERLAKEESEMRKAEERLTKEESEMKKAEEKKAGEKKAEEKKDEERKAKTGKPKAIAKQKVKKLKAEPIAKQVDETKSKDLEEVPPSAQVKARKQRSPPSQDWMFDYVPNVKRSRKDKCSCKDKESHKEKARVARRILAGSAKKNRMRRNREKLKADEKLHDSDRDKLAVMTAISPP